MEGTPVYIHPSSALFNRPPEWLVYHELLLTTREYCHTVTAIEPKWLVEVAPQFFKVADAGKVSKRKRGEKIEPLYNKVRPPSHRIIFLHLNHLAVRKTRRVEAIQSQEECSFQSDFWIVPLGGRPALRHSGLGSSVYSLRSFCAGLSPVVRVYCILVNVAPLKRIDDMQHLTVFGGSPYNDLLRQRVTMSNQPQTSLYIPPGSAFNPPPQMQFSGLLPTTIGDGTGGLPQLGGAASGYNDGNFSYLPGPPQSQQFMHALALVTTQELPKIDALARSALEGMYATSFATFAWL